MAGDSRVGLLRKAAMAAAGFWICGEAAATVFGEVFVRPAKWLTSEGEHRTTSTCERFPLGR